MWQKRYQIKEGPPKLRLTTLIRLQTFRSFRFLFCRIDAVLFLQTGNYHLLGIYYVRALHVLSS